MSLLEDVPTIGSGVEIRPSSIAGGGNGLWTSRYFRRNELITEYCGPIIDHRKALKLRRQNRHSHIRVLNTQFQYINGIKQPKAGQGGASFANDARDSQHNNSVFVCKHDPRLGRDRVYLKATRDLQPGTEVFVGYGRDYWKCSKQAPALPQKQQQAEQQQLDEEEDEEDSPQQQDVEQAAKRTRYAGVRLQHLQQPSSSKVRCSPGLLHKVAGTQGEAGCCPRQPQLPLLQQQEAHAQQVRSSPRLQQRRQEQVQLAAAPTATAQDSDSVQQRLLTEGLPEWFDLNLYRQLEEFAAAAFPLHSQQVQLESKMRQLQGDKQQGAAPRQPGTSSTVAVAPAAGNVLAAGLPALPTFPLASLGSNESEATAVVEGVQEQQEEQEQQANGGREAPGGSKQQRVGCRRQRPRSCSSAYRKRGQSAAGHNPYKKVYAHSR